MGRQKMVQNTRRGGHPPIGWLGVAAGLCLVLTAFHAHGAQWTKTSGTWSNTANWSGGTLPNGAGTDAQLYGAGGTITVDGDGATNSNYALTYLYNQTTYGNYVLNSGTLRFVASGTAVGSEFPSLAAGGGKTITLNTAITGSDGLSLFPWLSGTMAFGNSLNSYTGPTRLRGGTLRAEAANVLGGASSQSQLQIISTAATFNLNGFNQRVGSLASSGQTTVGSTITSITGGLITSASAATLTIGSDNLNATYTGTLAGGISLTKIGSGTQTLSGNSSYTGGTQIDAGAITASSSSAFGAGSIAIGGAGTARLTNVGAAQLTWTNAVTGSGVLVLRSGANTNQTTTANYAGDLSGFTGTVRIESGGDFVGITGNYLTGSNARWEVNNSTGSTYLSTASGTTVAMGELSGNGRIGSNASANTTWEIGALGTSSTFSGVFVNSGSTGNPILRKVGSGTLTLSGSNTYTGPLDVAAGVLNLSGAFSGADVIKTGGGGLTLSGSNGQANTTVNAGQLNVNNLAALGTLSGTLTMAAGTRLDNTSGGSVTVTNPKTIVFGTSVTFVGSNDLDLGTGTVNLSGNTEFDIQAKELTLSGDVIGSGYGIIKTGTGTLNLDGLTGVSSFTGNSFVNAGRLLISGGSVLGGGTSTTLTVADGAFLEIGSSASFGDVTVVSRPEGLITGTAVNANQTFDASGTLSTSNANFNGVQTIESGVTISTSHNYLGTIPAAATAGRIVFQDNARLRATEGFSIDSKQGISLASGTAVFETDADQALLIPATVAGSGGLLKVGAGNIRLTGSNTYLGGTVISQGIVGISYGESLGDVSGRLTLDGGTVVAAQLITGGSISTVTIDSAREVVLANGKTSGMDAQNGLTLRYDGVITQANPAGSAAGLLFGTVGPREGTVILGGANTYRGDTTIRAGTLKLESGGSFADSAKIIVGDASLSGTAAQTRVLDLTAKTSFSFGSTQTLMGKGTVLLGENTAVTISGLLSPGNSPGLLAWSGSGSVTLSGTTLMEVWGTDRGANPGYDAIDLVNGTDLTFGGILELNFDQLFATNTSFNLFTPDLSSSLTGNFSSITMVGSSYGDLTFTDNAGVWTTNTGANNQSMTFDSATGTLTILAVPEPAAIVLAGIGMAAAAVASRRRKKV